MTNHIDQVIINQEGGKALHRHVVRHISYLAKHPWTRRFVIVASILVFLISLAYQPSVYAANLTKTVTTKADWEQGTLDAVDTEADRDKLQLAADGGWGALSWAEPFDTFEIGAAFASDGTFIYATRGNAFPWFWRYSPADNAWSKMTDAPYPFGTGSDLFAVGSNTIYAVFGMQTNKFAKYTVSTNTWTELAATPDVVGPGGALTSDGTDLFLLRGNTSQDFYRYTVGTNTWSTLTGTPATIAVGADLVSAGNGYLYAFRGTNTLSFYRYDISAGTWSDPAVADLPSGALMNGDGNAVFVDGYIYKKRSAAQRTWYRYSVTGDSWDQLTDLPLTVNFGGLVYVSSVDRIYVFRGLSTRTFWAWDPDESELIGAAEPIIAGTAYTNGTGANLISDGSQYIYYLRGGNTNGLLRYDTSDNSWTAMTNATAAFNVDTFGVKAGAFLYFLRTGTEVHRYSIAGNSWSTMTALPGATGAGGGLVYPGTGDFIYALRGNGTASFYRYSIEGNSWSDPAVADLPTSPQTTVANIGARMVSDGTDLYLIPGNGSNRLLKYTVGTDTWSELAAAPFSSYYGTALEYRSGKIYALAGYYKNDFYEYSIAGNSWRKLADTQTSAATGTGAYIGASLAALGNTIYAIRGAGVLANTDFWTYTVSSDNYVESGSYVSPVYDFTYVAGWVSLVATTATPGDSSVVIETRSSADNSSWSSYQALSGTTIQSPAQRYFQVRVTLNATGDQAQTPSISDFVVTYTSDETLPTNPTSVTALSQEVGGTSLTSGQSYGHTSPYFSWTGGADAQSGMQGYYVYFGTNASADPVTAGILTGNSHWKVNTSMTTGTYYLRIRAIDNKDNIAAAAWDAFTYGYNGVSPSQSLELTSQAHFEAGTLTGTSAAQAGNALQLSSTAGSWKEGSLNPPPAAIAAGAMFAYSAADNTLYTFRGNNAGIFYAYTLADNTWTTKTAAPVNINLGGGIIEGPTGYLFAWAGSNSSTFMRYRISDDTWDDAAAADMPLGVTSGTAVKYDGSRYIYFLRGSADDAFWRYDTQTNQWMTLANTNFGNGVNQNVTSDSGMTFDGNDTIYALQGGNYPHFAKYTISTNTWTPLRMSPHGASTGASLVFDATTNSLYSLAGNARSVFRKYSITADEWTVLSEPPLPHGVGATQRLVGRTIYTLRGASTTAFWTYNIDTGLWTKPVTDLFGPKYAGTVYLPFAAGASIVKGTDNYFYVARGSGDNLFVRYDRKTGETVELAPIPHGLNSGGSLVYDIDLNEIYAATGTTRNFYKYSVATNSWSEMALDIVPNTLADGSEMVYHNGYVYLSRINNAGFYRYDVDGIAGSRWEVRASSTAAPGAGGSMVRAGNYIYMVRGANTAAFYRYDISANTWSDPLATDLPANVTTGGFLSDGDDGYLYASTGTPAPGNRWYRYDISGNSWTQLNGAPASWAAGADGAGKNGEQIVAFLAAGTNALSDGLYTFTQQTSTTSFVTAGTYLSASHNLTSVYRWANLTVGYTTPANTTVTIKTQSSPDNSSWSSLTEAANRQRLTGTDSYTYQIVSPAAQYLRVEITMTSDGLYTPTVGDYTINYYQDTTAPSNPSSVTAYNGAGQETTLTTNTWYNHAAPKFVWPAAGAEGGAGDNAGGSGIEGYYVYFGTDNSANPQITSGIINSGSAVQFQAATTLQLGSAMTSGQTYYLRLRARDNAQNIAASSWTAFTYRYDATAPTNPSTLSVNPTGFSAVNNYQFTWSTGGDTNSGVQKYQYRTGGDAEGAWTDADPPTVTTVTLPNGNHAEGQYQSGANVFSLRVIDGAGNASTPITVNYYFSGSAPTPPQNLNVSPGTATTNAFTADWDAPATYTGDPTKIKYRYSVNVLPTVNNTSVLTGITSVGPLALASQQGVNTFYVVAEDEAGNADYNLYASASFTINSSAPSTPTNFTVSDLSDRDAEKYGAAISWTASVSDDPTNLAGYRVYRSLDDDEGFSAISTTTGTAFVDQNLTGGTRYYYKVAAYTKTNVESSTTTVLSVVPTGRFTAPPTVLTNSINHTVYARRIKFNWVTTRTKGDGSGTSFVKCGLAPDNLNVTAGDFTQVVTHSVTIEGLTPSSLYYCVLYSTDIDGNTGEHGPIQLTTAPPPSVGDVRITDITLTKARINFTTSVEAKGRLFYGETSSFSSNKEFTSFQRDFSLELTGLKHTTTYFYGFEMITKDGDVFAQEVVSKFDTLPEPVVRNLQVEPVLDVDTPTLRITYESNVPIRPTLYLDTQGSKRREASNVEPLATSHEIIANGLLPLRTYTLEATGFDAYGNRAVAQTVAATTKDDTKAPEIISFVTESKPQTNGKTTIIAKVNTNEPTIAVLEIAQGSNASIFPIIGQEDALNQSHTLTASVDTGNIYSVRVKASDAAGNVTYSKVEGVSGGIRKPTASQIITRTLSKNFRWIIDLWKR